MERRKYASIREHVIENVEKFILFAAARSPWHFRPQFCTFVMAIN